MDAAALAALELPAIVAARDARFDRLGGTARRAARAGDRPRDGGAAAGADRGGRRCSSRAGRAPELAGDPRVRAAAARSSRDGLLRPRELRAIAASVRVALEARRIIARARCSRRCSTSASRRSRPRAASPTRSTAGSRRTAPTCATTRRRCCAGCARELRNGGARVREELARVARSSDVQEALQEQFLAERGGRPVLAVRASSRSKVPGIVHDASSTGQTLFVEPFAVVELNNRLAEAAADAREEVERILRELSSAVAAQADALHALVETTARSTWCSLRRALARAGAARRWRSPTTCGCSAPAIRCSTAATAVPIDLDLGAAARARDQRPEHRRQDGRAEDDRARGAAAPVRAASACRRGGAPGLRSGAGGHRRPAVDRDEPVDLLRPICARSSRSSSRRPAGRSCCSTRSQRAPIPKRALRSRRRCSRGSCARRG